MLRTEQQASFSVGKDSVGCTDDPDPFVITLNNLSEGDSLAYTWTVTPQQGVSFAEGDTNSESPKLLFSEPGDYDVRLAVSNGCHHDDDSDSGSRHLPFPGSGSGILQISVNLFILSGESG